MASLAPSFAGVRLATARPAVRPVQGRSFRVVAKAAPKDFFSWLNEAAVKDSTGYAGYERSLKSEKGRFAAPKAAAPKKDDEKKSSFPSFPNPFQK